MSAARAEKFPCNAGDDVPDGTKSPDPRTPETALLAIPEPAEIKWGGARKGAGRPRGPNYRDKTPIIPLATGPHWRVLQTHPQAEELVAREIARRGTETYCPLVMTERPDAALPTRKHRVLVPMIRGYVFVLLDTRDPWYWMREEVRGARDFLRNTANQPSALPDGWVEAERAKDAERLQLKDPAIPAAELKARAHRVGATALIEVGLYTDLRGTVVSCDGMATVVEVSLLGRVVQIERRWDQVRLQPHGNVVNDSDR